MFFVLTPLLILFEGIIQTFTVKILFLFVERLYKHISYIGREKFQKIFI